MYKGHDVAGPAALLGVVVAVTIATEALTYYIGRHVIKQNPLFVVNSQAVQQGSSGFRASVSGESAGQQDYQPDLRGQDLTIGKPVPGVDSEFARVGVAAEEKAGIDDASRVAHQSTLVSSPAVGVSPAVGGHVSSGSGNSAQPAGRDAKPDVQDSAQSVTSLSMENRSVSPRDTLSSNSQIQVAEPAGTDESARSAVKAAMRDDSRPAARDVGPATRGPRQPLAGGQAADLAVSDNKRIARLLQQAGEALSKDRLMTPAHRSAYRYYRQVLSEEPGNAEAHDGLNKIVERYVTLTRHAIRRHDKFKANQYITRALRVRPDDQFLLAIKDSINTMPASPQSEPPDRPLKTTPQEEEAPRNIFQRLRDFFRHHVPLN